jgi:hypothetical protein
MKINMAHLRDRSSSGIWINFVVFDARSNSGTHSDNNDLLSRLTLKARASGLLVDQAALVYTRNGRIEFFGSRPLVNYLSSRGLPKWTHKIDV